MGEPVAAGHPADDRHVVAQPFDLVFEIGEGQVHGLRRGDAAEAIGLGQAAIVFPFPLAAPAHQGEDAVFVAHIVHVAVFAPDVFEADGVEVHIFHQADLPLDVFVGVAHKDVVGPAGALDQDLVAVEDELPVAVFVEVGVDVPDAEGDGVRIGIVTVLALDIEIHMIQFGRTESGTPPQARIVDVEHRSVGGRDDDFPGFLRRQPDGHREGSVFEAALEQRFRFPVRQVGEHGADGQVGGGEVFLHLRTDEPVAHPDVAGDGEGHVAPKAHAFVDRTGVPVYVAHVEIALMGPFQRDFQFVGPLDAVGHVERVAVEDAESGVFCPEFRAVEADVGGIADAVELEEDVLPGHAFSGELFRVGPGLVERGFVDLPVVVVQEVFVGDDAVGVEDAGHGRRDRGVVRLSSFRALQCPAVGKGGLVARLDTGGAAVRRRQYSGGPKQH